MRITQAGAVIGVFAGLAAGAALVRWPYNLLSEAIIAAAALLAAATLVAWLIGLFYEKLAPVYQRVVLISAGTLLGTYLAISVAYFSGYLGYNYPASQQRIFQQEKEIASLNGWLDAFKDKLRLTESQLADAKKAMADPRSVTVPSYNLETSLKLQFDNDGKARAIDARNVNWDITTVLQAKEIPGGDAPQPHAVQQQQEQPDCSGVASFSDPKCMGRSVLTFNQYQCPKMECPKPGSKYETSSALLLILTFPFPIPAMDIKLDSYGAKLPENKILKRTNTDAVIMLQQNPRNLVLDISLVQSGSK